MSDNTPSLRHDLKIIFIAIAGIVLVALLAVKGFNLLQHDNDEQITAKKYKKSVLKKPRRRA